MRIAALYDVHGNLPALEAVLADVRLANVERIVSGGDIIPGPMPRECLDALNNSGIATDYILGNGDREAAAARRGQVGTAVPAFFHEAMRWNGLQLTDDDDRTIAEWPLTKPLDLPGIGRILFCHATPRNDNEIFTAETDEEKLRPIFEPLGVDVVVCGHVHMQFDRNIGSTRVVNAGSVGMPFQAPGAYWLLIDSRIELRRTDYDLHAAAERVRQTAYPLAEQFAATSILNPPTMKAMTDAFAAAELR